MRLLREETGEILLFLKIFGALLTSVRHLCHQGGHF